MTEKGLRASQPIEFVLSIMKPFPRLRSRTLEAAAVAVRDSGAVDPAHTQRARLSVGLEANRLAMLLAVLPGTSIAPLGAGGS